MSAEASPAPAAALLPPVRLGRPRLQRLRVIAALVLRGMGTRKGRASGGYLWAILEPIGTTLLLAIAFGLMLRSPPLGTSFILFYATGVLPLRHYGAMAGQVAGAIAANRGLLAYPVVNPLDAVFAQAALGFMTDFLVAVVILSGIALFTDADIALDLAPAAAAFVLAAAVGLGVGSVNCVLFGFFPTWRNVWSVLSRPLFLASGVLFLYETVPPQFQAFLWWNPMIHVTALMRAGFYGSYDPAFVSVPYVLGFAGTLFFAGGWLIRRHASFLIEQ
jgi:capsular polysaccharide transport system permease protein